MAGDSSGRKILFNISTKTEQHVASFLSLWKNQPMIITPCKALRWEMIYGNLGESLPRGPLSALPTKAQILCLDSL